MTKTTRTLTMSKEPAAPAPPARTIRQTFGSWKRRASNFFGLPAGSTFH